MSLQSSLACNALAFRNGKLQGPARKVGLSQPSQSQQEQQRGAAGSAQQLLRRAVQRSDRNADDFQDSQDFQDQDQGLDQDGEGIGIPSRAGDVGGGDGAAEAEPDQ